jgi:hypothetical protein
MPDYGYTHYLKGWKIIHKPGGKHVVYNQKAEVVAEFDNEKSAMNFLIGKAGK